MHKLEKITDDVFESEHPNGIDAGMQWTGRYYKEPTVGERFQFGTRNDHPRNWLLTSTVTEVIDDEVFKTRNSTYKLTKLED